MAIKNTPALLIYSQVDETEPPPYPTADFLIGIFDAPDAAQIAQHVADLDAFSAKSSLARLFSKEPRFHGTWPDAVCKAAAYVQDSGDILTITNVGAESGFGPTLYAAVMECARARGRRGVRPSTEPAKILDKPKRIWKQFHDGTEYKGNVLTVPMHGRHAEPWLNAIYSLAPGAELLDYEQKRAEWKTYKAFWKNSINYDGWRNIAFDMAQRSVEAHTTGSPR